MRLIMVCLVLVLAGCGGDGRPDAAAPDAPDDIRLESPSFTDGGPIPSRFTCDGRAGSPPPLRWSGVPEGTKELVLLVEDPDAKGGIYVHWVLPHLPPQDTTLPPGGEGWDPPCPPEGDDPHRYRFSLYALGEETDLTTASGGEAAHDAIGDADPLARGVLTGTYRRGG